MLYLEFNWTADAYQARFGSTFTDIDGARSFASLGDAREALERLGLCLGRKCDSRTWKIEARA